MSALKACLCPCIGSYDIKKLRYKFNVRFRITVKEIRFKRNDYFLKNSHYNFFVKRTFRSKIKGEVVVNDINELARLKVDDDMKLYASIQQSIQGKYTNRYKPVTRKLVIRQVTRISRYDEIYKDIGYVELPLHELIKLNEEREFIFPVVDPDDGLEATVRIAIERKLKNDPYAGPMWYRAGKYMGHEMYQMMFPFEVPEVPTRYEVNQVFFDALRQRDASEFREQIAEEDEQLALRREYERQLALRAKIAAEGEATAASDVESPTTKRQKKQKSDDDLQILQFSEDDFDAPPS